MTARALKISDFAPVLPDVAPVDAPAAPRKEAQPTPRRRLEVPFELLERCRDGDPDAFDTLFETTQDHVYTLALHFAGDESVAADVTQDVFLKLLDRIRQFRADAEFSTWLYRVVLNTFFDHQRRRRPWVPLEELSESANSPLGGKHGALELRQEPPQEDAAVRRQDAVAVRRALAELKPQWRALVVLRYSAGLGYEEIAEVLGIAPGTVASRLSRAHAKLAGKLRHLRD